MFRFIVRYLGFLKHVPLLATLLEACMMIYYNIANPRMINAIDLIEKEVEVWQGVYVSLHKFGGRQFNYHGKEIGHIHSNGILDILFPVNTKKHLLSDGRVANHHIFTKSGWISFYIQSEEDVEKAIDLLRLSLTSKRI